MSSASTIGLPFFKSNFVAPVITNGTLFTYALSNNFNIPPGNYLAWIYLSIRGDTDTTLGPVITLINNGPEVYSFTLNSSTIDLNGDTIAFQNTQVVSITNEEIINLKGQINFDNNTPSIAGIIYFYPI
jgi:hypothetical protein